MFWFVLRLLPFLSIYVLLSYEPQSDVRDYYYPIAIKAGLGEVMCRDVPLSALLRVLFSGSALALEQHPYRRADDDRGGNAGGLAHLS